LILGSSIGSGGAGIISQKICDESADLHWESCFFV
jgi:hypothetical protein